LCYECYQLKLQENILNELCLLNKKLNASQSNTNEPNITSKTIVDNNSNSFIPTIDTSLQTQELEISTIVKKDKTFDILKAANLLRRIDIDDRS